MSGIYHLALAYSIMIGSLLVYGRWLISRHRSLDKAVASTIEVQTPLPDDGGSCGTEFCIVCAAPPSNLQGPHLRGLFEKQDRAFLDP